MTEGTLMEGKFSRWHYFDHVIFISIEKRGNRIISHQACTFKKSSPRKRRKDYLQKDSSVGNSKVVALLVKNYFAIRELWIGPQCYKQRYGLHTCNHSTWEVEAGGAEL